MSSRSWLASNDSLLRARIDPASTANFQMQIAAEQQSAISVGDRPSMERFLSAYGSWPEADEIRLRLAVCPPVRREPPQRRRHGRKQQRTRMVPKQHINVFTRQHQRMRQVPGQFLGTVRVLEYLG